MSTLRTNIDDSISIGDDVEIMLDDKNRITLLNKSIEDIEELLYIREVQSRCRLIENIKCLTC
jgi:hypothetical protein